MLKRLSVVLGGVFIIALAALMPFGYVSGQSSNGNHGVVNPNTGSAGALATYGAAGGSTVLGPDAGLTSNGTGTLTLGGVGVGNGLVNVKGTTSGSITVGCTAATCTIFGSVTAPMVFKQIGTGTVCAAVGSAANPSVAACTSAASGSFSCATNASTGTCQVTSSSITANSIIIVTPAAATGGLTCNASADTGLAAPRLASSTSGSFTINLGTFATTALCFNYLVVN